MAPHDSVDRQRNDRLGRKPRWLFNQLFEHWRKIQSQTDSWTTTSTTNAPAARYFPHGSVDRQPNDRLGRRGFGGYDLNTGGRYCATGPAPTPTPTPSATASPTPTPTGTATATPTASPTPAPPCINDTWTATTTVNAPDARYQHTAVWTGSENDYLGRPFPHERLALLQHRR